MCRRILRSSYGWRTQRYWDRRMANVQKDIKIIVWLMHRRILIMIIKYRIWEISSLLWYHRSLTCVSCVYFYWHVSIVLWNEQQERGVLRSSYSWCTEGYWDRHMVDIQKHIEIVTWLICKRILRLSYGWCTEEYWDRHMAYVEKNIEIVIRLVYRRILRSSYGWCTDAYNWHHSRGWCTILHQSPNYSVANRHCFMSDLLHADWCQIIQKNWLASACLNECSLQWVGVTGLENKKVVLRLVSGDALAKDASRNRGWRIGWPGL